MTEVEWLTYTDPQAMLEFVRGKASDRKMRLYACACCRLVWHLFPHERYHRAIEIAERYADGVATKQELISSKKGIRHEGVEKDDSLTTALKSAILTTVRVRERDIVHYASALIANALTFERNPSFSRSEPDPLFWSHHRGAAWSDALNHEMKTLAHVFREVFGNPFRAASADPSWLSSTTVGLAYAIYDELAFARLPILADALEEAGCTSADILNHCRGPGPHVRGCWVVDLLLGKE